MAELKEYRRIFATEQGTSNFELLMCIFKDHVTIQCLWSYQFQMSSFKMVVAHLIFYLKYTSCAKGTPLIHVRWC
jgi:hypothetical protein